MRAERGGQVTDDQATRAQPGGVPAPGVGAHGEQVRDLQEVPSFPAVYAAALRPGRRRTRARELPDVAYRVRSVRIDAERAAAFDHLMGGAATEHVHPGVLHVLAFPLSMALMTRRDFPLSPLGLIHVGNRILQHRPVRVGQKVDVECRVRNLAPHRRGRTLEAVTTVLAQDGGIIATDVSTYLAKAKQAVGADGAAVGGHGSGSGGTGAGSGRGGASAHEPFRPGMPTARWVLPADTGRRYAEVSGDVNPIHMSALSARPFGFPRAIAHGMYTASRAFTEARVDLDRPLQWDVDFMAPVLLPCTVLVRFEDDPDSATGASHCVGWRPPKGDRPARPHFTSDVQLLG
jgi:acyl dehydratase